jgi:hypothetical protein
LKVVTNLLEELVVLAATAVVLVMVVQGHWSGESTTAPSSRGQLPSSSTLSPADKKKVIHNRISHVSSCGVEAFQHKTTSPHACLLS